MFWYLNERGSEPGNGLLGTSVGWPWAWEGFSKSAFIWRDFPLGPLNLTACLWVWARPRFRLPFTAWRNKPRWQGNRKWYSYLVSSIIRSTPAIQHSFSGVPYRWLFFKHKSQSLCSYYQSTQCARAPDQLGSPGEEELIMIYRKFKKKKKKKAFRVRANNSNLWKHNTHCKAGPFLTATLTAALWT